MEKDLTEQEIYDQKLWDLPIFEIKIDGIKDGLSFRIGQPQRIKGKQFTVSDIVRKVIDGEVLYMVFGRDEDNEVSLLKVSSGLPVYITFEV